MSSAIRVQRSPWPPAPPYRAYATIVGAFLAGLGAVSGIASGAADRPEQLRRDRPRAARLATFKASRTVARDKVTSFVREPFVEGEAYDGEASSRRRTAACSRRSASSSRARRCIGTWIGAGLAATQILAPRTGRLLTSVARGAARVNDFLLAGFSALTAKANELEQRGGVNRSVTLSI